MVTLALLPLELKVEILKNVRYVDDLIACIRTCKSLQVVRRSNFWDELLAQVRRNETMCLISAEVVAVLRIRNYKAGKSPEQLLQEVSLPFRERYKPEDENQRDLSRIRRVIRWHTRNFFKRHLERLGISELQTPSQKPSGSELDRVDAAFALLWVWLEASFQIAKRAPSEIHRLIAWGLSQSSSFVRVNPRSDHMLAVVSLLQSQLSRLGSVFSRTCYKYRTHFGESLRNVSEACFLKYYRIGLPNWLMTEFKLGGLQDLLSEGQDVQIQTVWNSIIVLIDTNPSLWGEDDYLLEHFNILIDSRLERPRLDLSTRHLWRVRDGVYNIYQQPWDQGENMDHEITFWDNKRLAQWGFYPPLRVTSDENVFQGNLAHRERRTGCRYCQRNWVCFFRSFCSAVRR